MSAAGNIEDIVVDNVVNNADTIVGRTAGAVVGLELFGDRPCGIR